MGQFFSTQAGAIRARVTASVQNIFGYFRGIWEAADATHNEENPPADNDQPIPGEPERRATIRTEIREEGTKHEFFFAIYNNEEEQIAKGLVLLDTAISPDSQILAYWFNPRIGEVQAVTLNYAIDFEVLRELFP